MRAQDADDKNRQATAAAPTQAGNATAAPEALVAGVSVQRLLALQATAGNAAVVQLLRRGGESAQPHQHGAGCGHQQAETGAGLPEVQRSAVHDVLRSAGRPLDSASRTDMEARLGADFSDVRVHDDGAARASAAEVGARAYTSGNHVVIGEGGGDKHTLAHELTHVIQQRRGPVAGTDNGSGLSVSDPSDRFEREAEANAGRVMSRPAPAVAPAADGHAGHQHAQAGPAPAVQRTRSSSGNPPLPAWDKVGPFWVAPSYGPTLSKRFGGTSATVTLGPSVNAPGNTYLGSTPQQGECTLVEELNARDGSGWIKGHLLNDNLGGPGVSANLTPMTASTNQSFNRAFEQPVKAMLLKCTNHAQYTSSSPIWYGVRIEVTVDPGRMSTNKADLEYHVPDGVSYTATYVQMDRATQTVSAVAGAMPAGFPAEIH
ncbi:eCIS core domain-containing protein [Kitasatospora viridis]|uniref:Uncharacterized protein DUF4157 n=1 Tax=Kitasatospora viridis TaxID=281105 RepID=A0A561TSN8_9ACTN|nr:DUF4157 domain-containing protein [Kitasatospora viridis]TWF90122.1 uncharacterized protein DUF4157 [Kitasatospora viridis]